MNFGEQIWCILSEDMSYGTFTPVWARVNENEEKQEAHGPWRSA